MKRILLGIIATGVGLFIYAFLIEPRSLAIRSLEIGVGENETRIVVLSDLHVGGFHVGQGRVRRIVEDINKIDPDWVLIPGDFINGHELQTERTPDENAEIAASISELDALNARKIATIGNHDNWYGGAVVGALLEASGFTILTNEALLVDEFCIVGLADDMTARPNAFAFKDCAEGTVILALMHSPDSRFLIPPHTAFAVAGHTHGGQVNLPVFGRAVTATQCGKPCAYGLIQTYPPLYVSSGIGTSMLPMRFRAKPEIVAVTLRY